MFIFLTGCHTHSINTEVKDLQPHRNTAHNKKPSAETKFIQYKNNNDMFSSNVEVIFHLMTSRGRSVCVCVLCICVSMLYECFSHEL